MLSLLNFFKRGTTSANQLIPQSTDMELPTLEAIHDQEVIFFNWITSKTIPYCTGHETTLSAERLVATSKYVLDGIKAQPPKHFLPETAATIRLGYSYALLRYLDRRITNYMETHLQQLDPSTVSSEFATTASGSTLPFDRVVWNACQSISQQLKDEIQSPAYAAFHNNVTLPDLRIQEDTKKFIFEYGDTSKPTPSLG